MEEKKKKRVPKCGYCRNHGMKMPIRGKFRIMQIVECFKLLLIVVDCC